MKLHEDIRNNPKFSELVQSEPKLIRSSPMLFKTTYTKTRGFPKWPEVLRSHTKTLEICQTWFKVTRTYAKWNEATQTEFFPIFVKKFFKTNFYSNVLKISQNAFFLTIWGFLPQKVVKTIKNCPLTCGKFKNCPWQWVTWTNPKGSELTK